MNALFWFKVCLFTVPVFFAVDLVWLGLVAGRLYQKNIGHLLSPSVNWPAAIVFYLIYIAGILYFAVRPGLEIQSLARACFLGGLFGFFTYATYDLTNLATLRDWPVFISVIDIVWGTVLCCLTAAGSYLIAVRLL